MPEPYIPPHEDCRDVPQLSPRVTAVKGQPPLVAVDRRRGRMLTTGEDTPALIALVACLVCLIAAMLIGRTLS